LVLTDYFGEKHLSKEEVERILDAYYEEKGWDVETGIPTIKKLV